MALTTPFLARKGDEGMVEAVVSADPASAAALRGDRIMTGCPQAHVQGLGSKPPRALSWDCGHLPQKGGDSVVKTSLPRTAASPAAHR